MPSKSFSLYKLHFKAPIHIGSSRDDYGISLRCLSSDSMYAALTAILAHLGSDIPSDGYLGCVISSLFPYYKPKGGLQATFFFPKPKTATAHSSGAQSSISAKQIKKVSWIDLPLLQRMLNGEDVFDSGMLASYISGEYLTMDSIEPDFVQSEIMERVTVSRQFEVAVPFYMERIYFKGDSGLFFLAEGDTSLIDKALPLLSEEGIGTDRHVGQGVFDYEKEPLPIDLPDHTGHGVSLSTFIPDSKDRLKSLLEQEPLAYDFSRIGGWITTPPYLALRKNAIYGFSPGSVFKNLLPGEGRIVDLAPKGMVSHPIWRCGKTLVLPIKCE